MAPETHRVPDPCPGPVRPVFIPEVARQYKYLLTIGTVHFAMISPRLEPFQHHLFSRIGSQIQRQRLQTGYVGMLVRKYSAEHEKLLAKRVVMRGKRAGGLIADEGRSPSHFTADAIQQTAFDAGLGRWNPWYFIRGDHDAAGEISVDEFVRHCGLLKSVRRMVADPSRGSRPMDAAMLVPGRHGPQDRALFASIEAGRIFDRSGLRDQSV